MVIKYDAFDVDNAKKGKYLVSMALCLGSLTEGMW